MLRQVFIATAVAALFVAPASAQRTELMPGVFYDRQVVFTPRGPAVIHVLTAPRPGGLYSLRPYLSNGTIADLESVSAIERRVSLTATVAGVNGDYFALAGYPSGMLMDTGALQHVPIRSRSSIGLDGQGNLHVDRISFFGTWQGSGQRRPLTTLNEPPGAGGVSLYTPAWGAATPATPGLVEATIDPFPAVVPGAEIAGPVTGVASGGNTPIPADGAVLVAKAAAARNLSAEAPVGQRLAIRALLKPDWTGVLEALGGGPVLVRGGKPVFRALEGFTTDQLLPRVARTAVGQKADGSILLVAADGSQPGYSVGVTTFELAQTMARLGAVTASALGSGASTTMAYEGNLLNRPSDPAGERPVSEALLVAYDGVYAPLPQAAVFSPNGDGIDDQQTLGYKVVRPSAVTASLVGPDGVARYTESVQRDPGTYPLAWSGTTAAGTPEFEGTWHWLVTATDDLGRQSSIDRTFSLNDTIGFLTPAVKTLAAPRPATSAVAGFTLTHPATVTATVETQSGIIVRTLPSQSLQPGQGTIAWDGRDDGGDVVYSGGYVIRVVARNQLGSAQLTTALTVRRVATRK